MLLTVDCFANTTGILYSPTPKHTHTHTKDGQKFKMLTCGLEGENEREIGWGKKTPTGCTCVKALNEEMSILTLE